MRKNTSGTSIVESIVVMLIITTGIVGMYDIFTRSQKLSDSTENRIEAIQIAREGIEAFTNIRNTNWILFAADYTNCWNTLNYDDRCIGDTASTDITNNGSYTIYQDPTTNRWLLGTETTGNYSDSTYRNAFRVNKDADGLYTQSGGTSFNPIFTREIQVQYIEDTNGAGGITSDDEKLQVTSKVSWSDSSRDESYTLELETILTNWKNKAN